MQTREPIQKVRITRLLGKFWTAANMLSVARLILVVPITYLILTDGRVARWSKTVSEWGKVLDPLADKAAAAMITMALVVRGSLPGWFLLLVVVRDVLIVLGGVVLARRTAHVVMSVWLGKAAVTALAVTVLAALLQADPPVLEFCVWTTTALLLYSFGIYCIRFVRLLRAGTLAPEENAPSLSAVEQSEARSVG